MLLFTVLKTAFKKKNLYFLIPLSLCLVGAFVYYFSFVKLKPNDLIITTSEGVALFSNENPTFNVDFGSKENPQGQIIRFEAEAAKDNPFEEKTKKSIFTKLAELFAPKKKVGIEMSLVGVNFSETEKTTDATLASNIQTVADILGTDDVETSTNLIDMGREIGSYDTEDAISKPTIVNGNIANGIDLEYQILSGYGLKEEIVINDLEAYADSCGEDCSLPLNKFEFDLSVDDGVVLKKGWFTVEGQSTEIYYFVDGNGKYLAHFLPSYAIDRAGDKTYEVDLDIQEYSVGKFRAVVTVDSEWLLSEDRVYPIRIDPSIVHDDTSDFSGGVFVRSEAVTGPKLQSKQGVCSGGTLTTYDNYYVRSFTSSGTLTCSTSITADILVVGGGGSGGTVSAQSGGGGGGGGGVRYLTGLVLTDGSHTVTVGSGGSASNGGDSSFNSIVASGGGKGGANNANGNAGGSNYGNGGGAGGCYYNGGTLTTGGSGGTGGYSGGNGNTSTIHAGGGAGAGGAGIAASATLGGGGGGNGVAISITGSTVYYGGGGGGGYGGGGGGGGSGANDSSAAVAGTANTGGGGGGGYISGGSYPTGANGGSGIVVVRYSPSLSPYSQYISSTLDFSAPVEGATLSWISNGINTGDGETPYSTTGLVAQWNFNETSGTTAVSGGTCGTSCNGTLTNMTTSGQDAAAMTGWTANNRRWGAGALMFDGSNDYVDIGDFELSNEFTFEGWIKTSQTTGAQNEAMIIARGNTANTLGVSVWMSLNTDPGYLYMGGNDSSGWNNQKISDVKVNDGQWHYFAVVFNQSNHSGIGYVDGKLGLAQTYYFDANNYTPKNTKLGKNQVSSIQYFNGIIDSTRIYSRALSTDEILSNYQAGNIEFQYRVSTDGNTWSDWLSDGDSTSDASWNTFDNPYLYDTNTGGLVAYWPLEEASGSGAYIEDKANYVPFAVGGTITYSGGYTIHTFTSTSALTVFGSGNIEVLVVAGGGGGGKAESNAGGDGAGGGGAGGLVYNSSYSVTAQTYSATVGLGGSGSSSQSARGVNGGDSVFGTITAVGGGGGGTDYDNTNGVNQGATGGSGGGTANAYSQSVAGGSGTSGQGNDGGGALTNSTTWRGGSGGGGAGATGTSRTSTVGGAGGVGLAYSISGTSTYYAGGGGGGGCATTGGVGGTGGGGAGGGSASAGTAGTANTGGGGGGGGSNGGNGGAGGSGIVVVRYPSTYKGIMPSETVSATGGTVTYSNGYAIHTFTSSGTFTVTGSGSVEVLVVAGGGGGGKAEANSGGDGAGGGGAGGLIYNTNYSVTSQAYTVTIGTGGTGTTSGTYPAIPRGTNGGNSVFGSLTAIGGGGGGSDNDNTNSLNQGADGGSGGGAANAYNQSVAASSGTSGQGNAGGGATTNTTTWRGGSGGGGAGIAGYSRTSAVGGAGGAGLAYSVSGTLTYYAGGGGGGGCATTGGAGGTGGGGAGGGSAGTGTAGTANTGGGGGGGGSNNGSGGNGGSGIVIIRYFAFSEGSDGTPTGTTYVSGKYSGARSFNGTSDYVNIASNLGITNGDITIEAWVKPSSATLATDHTAIVSHYDNSAKVDYRIFQYTTGIGVARHAPNVAWNATTEVAVTAGTWYHVVLTYSGTTLSFYLNGILRYTATASSVGTGSYTTETTIGRGTANTQTYFGGVVDEVRIFNTAISSSQIQSDYIQGLNTLGVYQQKSSGGVIQNEGTNSDRITNSLNTGLVSYWKLDESSGTSLSDSVGSNTGTATGTSVVTGKYSNARSFNGSSDYIGVSSPSNIPISNTTYTIEAWIYPIATGTRGIVGWGNYGSTNQVNALRLNSTNQITNYWWGNDLTVTVGTITTSVWHHVVATFDGTTRKIYYDGNLAGSGAASGHAVPNANNFRIGSTNNGEYFSGYLDEVKIYNIAKTADEILEEYNATSTYYTNYTVDSNDLSDDNTITVDIAGDKVGTYSSLTWGESAYANYQTDANTLGLWHMDEISGSGAYIQSATGGNSGTPTGTTYTSSGKLGGARSFNGSSDYVTPSGSSAVLGNNARTISAWIKTTKTTAQAIVTTGTAAVSQAFNFVISYGTSGYVGVMGYGNDFYPSTGTVVTDGQWHFVNAVYNGSGTISIYVDGKLNNSGSYTYSTTGQNNFIGKSNDPSYLYYFSGSIDEVRIDNTARTADQIRQAYEVGLRTHNITVDFGATLNSSNLIANSSDTSFTIDATTQGLDEMGSNLYVEDKIIVREVSSGTEYIAQGSVSSITELTGATEVSSWDSESTFPSGGFTTKASVFKWQREYIPVKNRTIGTQVDATSLLTLRLTSAFGGRNIWIDNLRTSDGHLANSSGEELIFPYEAQYFQYKALIMSQDTAVTPYISQVQVDYEGGGPTLEQLMRHGQWFDSGGAKKGYWWVGTH